MSGCDWPGCGRTAAEELALVPGMSMRIGGVAFDRDTFHVCGEHAPEVARIVHGAIDDGLRRHAARTNLAPGDAEWSEYFDDG